MDKFFEIISASPLFTGIARTELSAMLSCLGARTQTVQKAAALFSEGDPANSVGMVLEGGIQIERSDFYGNRSVITSVGPGGLFAEMFACAGIETLPVSAIATADSTVMLMDVRRILTTCSNSCIFHNTLIENLLHAVARKNIALNSKIHCMSQRSTREKLMTYLLETAKIAGACEFTIPYDRQGLADYLGVERSAMSAEISKLKKEGIIDTRGSWFNICR